MMKRLVMMGALGALALGAASSANAATVVLDDFTWGPQRVYVGDLTDTFGIRTLTMSGVADIGDDDTPEAEVSIGDGLLLISNGPLEDHTLELSYAIAADASLATANSIRVDVASSNWGIGGEDNEVEAFLNGNSLGVQSLAEALSYSVSFGLSGAEAALLAGGATLSFVFNGSPDFDIAIGGVTAVPEPAMLGLFGLGLIGLGAARRRRTA